MSIDDRRFMTVALGLAARGLGLVAPNPAVGCVLVRDGVIVGRGWTQPGGRPHAETEALRRAGARAAGSTAYVTLEPCSHHGKTPPCADALIAVGVARVVAALGDPDHRVSGRGFERLKAAGIAVTLGVCEDEAASLNRGFLLRIKEGRPLVTLKLATSLDGRLATHSGESQWITGPRARAFGHLLRRRHDAVLVGSGTVLADDPLLTVRLPGLEAPAPLRVIVDGRLRTPLTAKLVAGAATIPTCLITLNNADPVRRKVYEGAGVDVISVEPDSDGTLDLRAGLQALGKKGVTRVLVEGGATLGAGLLRAGLVDRLAWFRSGGVIGGDGLAAVKAFGVGRLADQPVFERTEIIQLDNDILETLERQA